MRMVKAAPIAACLILAACGGNGALTVLPPDSGEDSSVAILESGGRAGETLVTDANSQTSLTRRGPVTRPIDPSKLSTRQKALIDALPPPPVRLMLYFKEGTTIITPASQPTLDWLKGEIADRPGVEAQVTGYTDTLGSSEDNDLLSQARANEILEMLVGQGVKREFMTAVGRGERSLRVQTADGVRNAANRRVEVVLR